MSTMSSMRKRGSIPPIARASKWIPTFAGMTFVFLFLRADR
jgi:hypothetical protein